MTDATDGKNGEQSSSTEQEAEKVKEIAERAGGGSNKGSDLGSNEDIDQVGGQAHDRSS
jgi:hypothetical protein